MFTVADFVSKYDSYSDEELMDIHSNMAGYSIESQEALHIVIQKKGGLDKLLKNLEEKQTIENEINRIRKETAITGSQNIDPAFIKTVTNSNILPAEKVKEIIDTKYKEIESELDDKKIKPRTIVMGSVGAAIASLIGGALWGLQLIYSHRIFFFLLAGLVLICYGIIKVLTRQSYKNLVVIIATIVSVILSVLIGTVLYNFVGYQG